MMTRRQVMAGLGAGATMGLAGPPASARSAPFPPRAVDPLLEDLLRLDFERYAGHNAVYGAVHRFHRLGSEAGSSDFQSRMAAVLIARENRLLPAELQWIKYGVPATIALNERGGAGVPLPDFQMADGSSYRSYIEAYPRYKIPPLYWRWVRRRFSTNPDRTSPEDASIDRALEFRWKEARKLSKKNAGNMTPVSKRSLSRNDWS